MAIPLQVQNQNPLQGNTVTLQGSVQPVQGAAQVIQGPQFPAQKPPVQTVTPPKPVQTAAPAQMPQPQPVFAQPQTFRFDSGQQVQVDQMGNATPLQQQLQQPQQQPQQNSLSQSAGAANLGVEDYLKLISGQTTLTQAERDAINSNYGLSEAERAAFAPSTSATQLYNDAFSAAGLADIKKQFSDLQTKINTINEKYTEQFGKVNDNPFLSEASRVGRQSALEQQRQAEVGNLGDQAQTLADLYNQGLGQVENLVTRQTTDFTNNQNLNNAKLTYLQKKAEDAITKAQNDKTSSLLSRYLPEYLNSKAQANKPTTVTAPDGTVLQYNASTGKFDVLYQGAKNQTVAPGGAIVNPITGEVVYQAPYKPSVVAIGGANGLSSSLLTKVQTVANQFDGEQIVKDFNVISSKYQTVSQILNSKLGGPGDLAVVYEFMKGLDPTSVVRETEYASAAKSGNIFAGAFAKFNGYLKPEGGFLPDSVKQSFQSILNTKLGAAKTQYDNVYSEYGRRINKLTGDTDGTEYITNYGQAFESQATSVDINDLF